MNEESIFKNSERTEEIQAIIERMPTKFGKWITFFVLILVVTFFILGWVIRYPDVITGEIVINANSSPIKLVANSPGKLYLNNFQSQDNAREGDYIAIIQNSAKLKDIQEIHRLIKSFNVNNLDNDVIHFPKNVSLGDLNTKYFLFIDAYDEFIKRHKQELLSKQEDVLRKMLIEQQNVLNVSIQKLKISSENVRLMNKFHKRDSTLFKNRALTEAEIDKSDMNFLSANDAYHTMINNITNIREQIQETSNKIQQITIQKSEEEGKVRLNLITFYTDLADSFKIWEQKYAFIAPIKGKVQFSKFWTNDQFIQAGEPVFTVVPLKDKIVGQMTLPAFGAGKVKVGQEVIIKLENYPYREYGSITGKVSSISLTTNTLKTDKGEIETYLIYVDLPEELKTNYGSKLDFKYEIKGSGEIITKDRKLIERLFDNMRYGVSK
ncbi:MAG: HlyD family efflux transporter periplasmic adaptor subunit [Daejeonella sp.]